jgi:hypothetical protein
MGEGEHPERRHRPDRGFAPYWTPAIVRRCHADTFGFLRPWNEVPALMGSTPPARPPSTGTGVVIFLDGVASNAGMIDWIKTVRDRRVRQKAAAYPEYVAILHAARALGRPVKWCDERADSFLLDQQGRGTVVDAELALDQAGNFLCGLARDPLPDGRATCQ